MVAQINRINICTALKAFVQTFVFLVAIVTKCFAEPTLLTDDETETLMYQIAKPVFDAAGIACDFNKIHILNDMSLNAFVSDGNHLFLHTGTILEVKNTNELFGIIAHEAGHIAGGHIMRQKLKMNDLRTLSAISLIAAGTAAVASGRGDAAMAVALGSHGSLINSMIFYRLTEERSADESAVKYLKKIGQSPIGLENFMKAIEKNNRLSGYEETPYFKTHPMNAERKAFFDKAARENGGRTTSPFDGKLKLVQAKLGAFLLNDDRVLMKYPDNDKSMAAQYAHAIIAFRHKKFAQAVALMDNLIEKQPDNPYFYELKGQFLFEGGKITEAVNAYKKALKIKPDSNETMLLYAESALELPQDQKNLTEIIGILNKLQIRQETPRGWELLSRAYHEQGRNAQSLYAAAKFSFLSGRIEVAKKQIDKAFAAGADENLKLKLSDLQNQIENEKDE